MIQKQSGSVERWMNLMLQVIEVCFGYGGAECALWERGGVGGSAMITARFANTVLACPGVGNRSKQNAFIDKVEIDSGPRMGKWSKGMKTIWSFFFFCLTLKGNTYYSKMDARIDSTFVALLMHSRGFFCCCVAIHDEQQCCSMWKHSNRQRQQCHVGNKVSMALKN